MDVPWHALAVPRHCAEPVVLPVRHSHSQHCTPHPGLPHSSLSKVNSHQAGLPSERPHHSATPPHATDARIAQQVHMEVNMIKMNLVRTHYGNSEHKFPPFNVHGVGCGLSQLRPSAGSTLEGSQLLRTGVQGGNVSVGERVHRYVREWTVTRGP